MYGTRRWRIGSECFNKWKILSQEEHFLKGVVQTNNSFNNNPNVAINSVHLITTGKHFQGSIFIESQAPFIAQFPKLLKSYGLEKPKWIVQGEERNDYCEWDMNFIANEIWTLHDFNAWKAFSILQNQFIFPTSSRIEILNIGRSLILIWQLLLTVFPFPSNFCYSDLRFLSCSNNKAKPFIWCVQGFVL